MSRFLCLVHWGKGRSHLTGPEIDNELEANEVARRVAYYNNKHKAARAPKCTVQVVQLLQTFDGTDIKEDGNGITSRTNRAGD